jgi:hypothetical protein
MLGDEKQLEWERCIEKMLGDESPCKLCLVKVTCKKSFTSGGACETLAIKLERKINETQT